MRSVCGCTCLLDVKQDFAVEVVGTIALRYEPNEVQDHERQPTNYVQLPEDR